ncbi:hypothetical protein ALTERO38_50253 [Alteromonas sp. 38]|nr:hypothetical protein ALTER154_81016 [Alteromonas sp. 154]VXB26351.1 hypothetical protein ALTERO38_50253 [Alteromonas sp. 38]
MERPNNVSVDSHCSVLEYKIFKKALRATLKFAFYYFVPIYSATE